VVVVLDQHIKIPPNSKTGLEGSKILSGRDKAAHQSTVFLFGGLCDQLCKKERADDL